MRYDTTKVPYNPGNENRDKLKGYDTVADLINGDWEFPPYEPQRPAGAYLVDTAPVNTDGKGASGTGAAAGGRVYYPYRTGRGGNRCRIRNPLNWKSYR